MILIGGQLEGISTRKDKTLKLTIGTQELNPNQASEIFGLNQQYIYVGIKEEPFTEREGDLIDSLRTDIEVLKTPSQRLRGVIYKNYEQDNKGYIDFGVYYAAEMEKLINHYKNKLD